MPNQPNDAAKGLETVLDALQKSLLEASDEEVVKELRAAGVDPFKATEVMTFAEERAVDDHFRRVREKLAQERSDALRKINGAAEMLPGSRSERLDLLRSICTQHSQVITAQFREFENVENLSDSEISSMLQHLVALGYIASADGSGQ